MKRRLALALVLAVAMVAVWAVPAMAQNPTVSITVRAEVVAITNSQNTWDVGVVVASDTPKWGDSDTYSEIENTGTVAVDVEIRGTDLTGGGFTWTLAEDGNAGSEIYGLKATTGTEYNVLVKKSNYANLTTNLAAAGKVTWSMTMYVPTAFHADEAGVEKSATVTLVASKAS